MERFTRPKRERGKDIEVIQTSTQKKRTVLYYLYLYHLNYQDEPRENKAEIREHYERRLRYKGAFYRDKKIFEQRGNPLNWTNAQVERFFSIETEEVPYYTGMTLYRDFIYPSTNLIELDVSKDCNIVLLDVVDNIIIDSMTYEREIKNIIRELQNIMEKIDQTKTTIIVRKGYQKEKKYNLSYQQITFKLKINDYVRYISTRVMPKKFVAENSILKLQEYLREISKLEQDRLTEENPSKDFDETIFTLEQCILQRVYLIKRTNRVSTRYQNLKQVGRFEFDARLLSSIEILAVAE